MTIRALFWDVGGVLLSNAWDHTERAEALRHFHVDEEEFRSRHEMVVSSFERGKISLDEYLDRTVFFCPRLFSREEFKQFMFSLSRPRPEVLEFARALAASEKYRMSTINNESGELNQYRIEKFGLREIFTLFVSSCFVGLRKPDGEIYKLALDLAQAPAAESCFIDDRAENLECAQKLGMHTIQMRNLDQLKADLQRLGVSA